MAETWEARMAARAAARRLVSQVETYVAAEAAEAARHETEAARVRAALLPRMDAARCAHGRFLGDHSHLEGLVFACPFGFCECCQQRYPYIDTGWLGSNGSGGSVTNKHLCTACGGRVRSYGQPLS